MHKKRPHSIECGQLRKRDSVPAAKSLLSVEGHTIGALLYGGIRLMRADTDHFQRAVVLFAAVVLALGHGALNAAVRIGIAVHILTSSLIGWS